MFWEYIEMEYKLLCENKTQTDSLQTKQGKCWYCQGL